MTIPSPALRYGLTCPLDADASRVAELLDRATSTDAVVRDRTAAIIERVRRRGDAALLELARELDGVSLAALEVPRDAIDAALARIDAPVRAAMERAARNIAAVHRAMLPAAVELEVEPGITIGRRPDPLGTVGIYAPGGRAAYPSSVLMGAVPARVAGVGTLVLCSPPGADGLPAPAVLAAAALARVDRVFAIGGAGAVAAMALGTDTVPRADRVVGPGNAYVAEAKLQLCGAVGIDAPAGPSELLIVAGADAPPALVAREAVAQAEHDPRAAVVIVALDPALAMAIDRELAAGIPHTPRAAIVREALAARGALLWSDDPDAVIAFVARYAPEHLLLAGASCEWMLPRIRNAGTVFVGSSSSVAFGDYMTGANHVLPTGGAARAYSGLSTLDFFRWTTYQRITPDAAARLAADVEQFACAEGLPAHAAAAAAWREPAVP